MIDIEESINRCQLAESVTQPAAAFLEILLELKAANAKLSRYEAVIQRTMDVIGDENNGPLRCFQKIYDDLQRQLEPDVLARDRHGNPMIWKDEALEVTLPLKPKMYDNNGNELITSFSGDCLKYSDGRHTLTQNSDPENPICICCGREVENDDGKSSCIHGDTDPLCCSKCKEDTL